VVGEPISFFQKEKVPTHSCFFLMIAIHNESLHTLSSTRQGGIDDGCSHTLGSIHQG
jgi:hypothetical protein